MNPNANTDFNDNATLQLLQTMYNNNVRQIDQLIRNNGELQRSITDLIRSSNPNHTANNSRSRRQFNNNTPTHINTHTPTHINRQNTPRPATPHATPRAATSRTPTNTANNRVYLNNVPYIISDVQRVTIPARLLNEGLNVSDTITTASATATTTATATSTATQQYLNSFFEPVNVYPTQRQINAATRTVQYGDIVRPTNQSCPITLDMFNETDEVTIIRHCSHIFSTTGINYWFRTSCKCPICRYDIRNYNPVMSSSEQDDSSVENADETNETNPPEEPNLSNNVNLNVWLQNIFNSGLVDASYNDVITTDASNNMTTDTSYNSVNPSNLFYFTYEERQLD
jgi:hypothetical protein